MIAHDAAALRFLTREQAAAILRATPKLTVTDPLRADKGLPLDTPSSVVAQDTLGRTVQWVRGAFFVDNPHARGGERKRGALHVFRGDALRELAEVNRAFPPGASTFRRSPSGADKAGPKAESLLAPLRA